MMSEIKIQPWENEHNQDITYINKLNTLSNFKTSTNLKKIGKKKNQFQQQSFAKMDKTNKTNSALTTMNNFHKTNRSQYKHRVTKLVFSQQSAKKYKFQPELLPKKRMPKLFSPHQYFKATNQHFNRNKSRQEEPKGNRKQIYYNLTQLNSPLNSLLKTKCFTQQTQEISNPKIKIFQKIRREKQKKNQNLPVFRQLSIQRKIYVLQSGNRSQKYLQKQSILSSKKSFKKSRNLITQICKYQRNYQKMNGQQ